MEKEVQLTKTSSVNDRYLVFQLGEEFYAMPLLDVREVIAVPDSTPVPNSPDHFTGIMNLRGQVISIFDLRKKLNIKPADKTEENAVIIIDINSINIGIVIDEVSSVQAISEEEISGAPELDSKHANKYLYGVAKKNDKLILMIDLTKVLDVKDLEKAKKSA